jgi:DNA-binding SARP family transcriptional activator
LALLAASEPRGVARDRLLLLLWPESTTDRARGALYQLLYAVRQSLGEDSVVGSDELSLAPHVVSSDVGDFTAAIARDDLDDAVDMYGGPFLDAVHVSGAPELERWIEQKRQELARAYQSALHRLGSRAMEKRDFAAAVSFAERLIAADPLSDRATVLMMEALAASGDVTAALERARIHASLVRQELGADVDGSVSALVARLRTSGGNQPIASAQEEVAHAGRPPAADKEPALESASAKPVVPTRRRNRAIAFATAAMVVIAVAGIVAMRWPRAHAPESAVVAEFETPPADSQIAEVLTDAVRRALSDSRSLVAYQDNQVRDVRRRLGVPDTEKLDVALARKLAMGAGIRTVVRSSLTSFAGGYAISMRLISAPTGQVLATAERTGIAPRQILVVLDTLTLELREHAGYDLEVIRAQPSLLALTSRSLEAMTDYVAALRLPPDSAVQAVRLLRAAVERDTSFASAIWQLSYHLERAGQGDDEERRALLARAWAHRDGLTEYELLRLEIAYLYSPNGKTPDVVEHLERLRRVVERHPNADDAQILADFYLGKRQLVEAESTYRLEIALDSTRPGGFIGVVSASLSAKHIPEARRAVDLLVHRFPTSPFADGFDAMVAYAEGNLDRARKIFEKDKSLTDRRRDLGYAQVAEFDLLEGRLADFYRGFLIVDSLRAARGESRADSPSRLRLQLSVAYWVRNRPDAALRILESTLVAHPALRHTPDAAEFYAQFGRPDSARALLAARGSVDRTIYAHGTDTLPASAWIDMAEGRPREAAAKFRESLRFAGGAAASRVDRDPDIGLAFERAGMADSAIAVYEHYLNATTSWESDAFKLVPILEHVAPLYERRGDRAKAKAAYARIAELWKDPDPELRKRADHARERFAALR